MKITLPTTSKRLFWWFAVWLILLPNQSAQACSLAPIPIKCSVEPNMFSGDLRCLNQECSLRVVRNSQDGFLLHHLQEATADVNAESFIGTLESNGVYLSPYSPYSLDLETVDTICAFDFKSAPTIEALYRSWDVNDYRGMGFAIQPYTETKQNLLEGIKGDLLSCTDVAYVEENGTLASFDFTRNYCSLSLTPFTMCGPGTMVSPLRFAIFAFGNPNLTTLPYILGISAIIIPVIAGGLILQRRGRLGVFLKPSKLHMWGLAIGLPIICIVSFFRLPYFSYQLIVFYLILSIANYTLASRNPR